jgi:hypothetical protein
MTNLLKPKENTLLNKYEYVIKTCDYVEQSLTDRYPFVSCCTNFNDKLVQLNSCIPYPIMKLLHTISQQSSFLAHNQESCLNWASYDYALNQIHNWLGIPVIFTVPDEIRQSTAINVSDELEPNDNEAKDILLAIGVSLARLRIAGLL